MSADLAQYFGHVLRVSQKLAYIYGWPDLFDEEEELGEATEGVLTLFVGVMFGVHSAQAGVSHLASQISGQVLKKLPQQALTKGVVYPLVKKVATKLGYEMTKKIFAGGVAKIVPFVGAVINGGMTLGTFMPMSRRLEKHLVTLELAVPPGDAPSPLA